MFKSFFTQLHKFSDTRQTLDMDLGYEATSDALAMPASNHNKTQLHKDESHILDQLINSASHTAQTTTLLIKNLQTGQFDAFNTSILDSDLNNNELYLDAPSGTNYHSLFDYKAKKNTVIVEIKTHNGRFCITGHINNLLRSIGNHIEIHFLATHYEHTNEKRRLPRLTFDKASTPKATLQVKGGKSMNMDLADISLRGARCILAGHKQTHHLYARPFESPFPVTLTCKFSDTFTLEIQAQVIYLNYHRVPYCHNIVRLIFSEDDTHAYFSLESFINFALTHHKELVA